MNHLFPCRLMQMRGLHTPGEFKGLHAEKILYMVATLKDSKLLIQHNVSYYTNIYIMRSH